MIDKDLKYCPRCNDEYRAEIEQCAACNCRLLSGEEVLNDLEAQRGVKKSRGGDLTPDDELVTVARAAIGEIKVYNRLINEAEIATLLAGDEKSCGKGCCGGGMVDLLVRREEAMEAAGIVEAEIRRASRVEEHGSGFDAVYNPAAAETVCPACGHRFPTADECPECGLCF